MTITDNDDAIRVLLEQAGMNWRLTPDTRQAMRMGAKSMQRELDRVMRDVADYHAEPLAPSTPPATGTFATHRIKTLEGALVACREKFNWYAQNHFVKGTLESRLKADTNQSYVRMVDRILDGKTT